MLGVKGNDMCKTLTCAVKRLFLVTVFASPFEDSVFKFWERLFFLDVHFFFLKEERKSSFCRQNQGHMLDVLSPQVPLSLAGSWQFAPLSVHHPIPTFDLRQCTLNMVAI